ncbi:MAG TPA: type II secretion system F family protein [Caulobacteraceae bacterium]|nr:type II secretion system F family protein [Caulobacteraceae bacterium]
MNLVATLTNHDNQMLAGAAALTFATIVTLAGPMMKRDTLDARMKSVANRREELRRRSREAMQAAKNQGGSSSSLRQTDQSLYKKVVDRLNLSRLLEDPKVAEKLAQAGFRGPKPISTFYFFRFVSPMVLAGAVAAYIFFINDFHLTPIQKLAAILAGLLAGYYGPNLYISNVAQKRRESIMQSFPDALDLLLICVESGMSIEAAMQKVSGEIGGSSIELAEELTLLVAELSYLPERRMAYDGLARRTNHPGIKAVMTAMIQAERYGTALGTALRTMAKENRELRLAAAEKKAASLPAKLTVPMIIFFLPALFIVVLGPAIMQVQDTMK